LCEATCGLELRVEDGAVTRVRGDRYDVFSAGFICPKGSVLHRLHDDPDRLARPQVRRGGVHVPVDWPEAFTEIQDRLLPIIEQYGRDAVAVYIGNPSVHSPAGQIYVRPLVKALGTHHVFSASTVDQMPKHVSAGLMFGHPLSIPVPDIDRTEYLLMLGANPKVSNGSLATAPDWPGRMTAIRDRGGRIVVVDPRRTESADMSDEHLFIRPGTDAAWLAAVVTEVLRTSQANPGRLADFTTGIDDLATLLDGFTPDSVATVTGISADATRRIAAEFAAAPTAVAYGRLGTHAGTFGTLSSWLVDVLNVVTGNLDRPGGAMFPRASTERPRTRPFRVGRWRSRVANHPEMMGELPVAALAEEILTPGDGQIRALITIAGNPLRSTPDTGQLTKAIESLELVISIDPYLGETASRADVVLPPPSALQRSHYDLAFQSLSVRNVVNWSPPTLPLQATDMPEWEILTRLALIAAGQGTEVDVSVVDTWALAGQVRSEIAQPGSPIAGRDASEIMGALGNEAGPDRIIDFLVRIGPYGDGFGALPGGLNMDRLRTAPHGIDFGPLEPRLPDLLCTESGQIDLSPGWITDDLPRLRDSLFAAHSGELVLIGRRHLQSNNSWMHNVAALNRGKERCTLLMHPDDASEWGLTAGGLATITTDAGSVTAAVAVSDEIMPGVVSLPHGWGHDDAATRLGVAAQRPGADANALTGAIVDPVSGNAVLNGIPVQVNPA
jgi:anaerobic selenocysteine-containing dehydrogenase